MNIFSSVNHIKSKSLSEYFLSSLFERASRASRFKIGTPMEHAERYQVPRPPITAREVGFLHAGGEIPCRPHPAATQLVIIIILWPPAQSLWAQILKKSVNGRNGDSFGGHCVLEGDRIPLLKSHGQVLGQKHCFSDIFSDGCDASANLLNKFDGQASMSLLFPRQLDRKCAC